MLLALTEALAILAPQWALFDATERARQYRDSGAATLIVQSEAAIDGRRCEAFAELDGVRAAGAVREVLSGVPLAVLPNARIRDFEASPQFADVLGATRTDAGLLVSEQISDLLGKGAGDTIRVGDRQARIAGTYPYPDDGRVAGLGNAMVGEVPAWGVFDECWLIVWPQNPRIDTLAAFAADANFAAAGPKLIQANTSFGPRFEIGFIGYIWEHSATVAMLLAAIIAVAFVRSRRLELASARHVGMRIDDQLLILLSETVAAAVLALVLLSPAAMLLATSADAETAIVHIRYALRGSIAVVAGSLLGTVAGALTVREHHLFRYLRQR